MDNFMILGYKHFTGVYKENPYDFVRIYVGKELTEEGAGWENFIDDYHNKVKTVNLPDVLPVSSLKQMNDVINRPCRVLFNRYGGIERIELV